VKEQFFHGSAVCIDGPLLKGTCVSRSKYAALLFAQRRRKNGDCYIYTLLLDPAVDLERVDAGAIDQVLARDTPFSERNLVTPQLIEECKESIPKGFS